MGVVVLVAQNTVYQAMPLNIIPPYIIDYG
jgi:hypothetical protein